MDVVLNNLGYVGYGVAIISGIYAYVYKDRYKTLITDIYEPGNRELREQVNSLRSSKADLEQGRAADKAKLEAQEAHIKDLKELNSNQPNFAKLLSQGNSLARQMSTNHKVVINKITELAKARISK